MHENDRGLSAFSGEDISSLLESSVALSTEKYCE